MAKKQAQAPQVQNAAPGYDPYARPPGGAPPAAGVTAPGAAYGAPPQGGVAITPPPPRVDSQFVNKVFLWQYGKPINAVIKSVRDATGTGKTFEGQPKAAANKRAWFLDFVLEGPHPTSKSADCTGRINEGDTRHSRLWAAYQGNWVGQRVVLRLTNPGDIDPISNKPSRAEWMLDAQ